MSSVDSEILKVTNLRKSFGSLHAIAGVDISLRKSELRAVIGPNGAGKTTLFNLITGELKPDGGEVIFNGLPIAGLPPHRIMRLKIARSFQITSFFPELTVFENVMIPVVVQQKREFALFRSAQKISELRAETYDSLKQVGIENLENVKGNTLSHGDKKRLELAIVLACKPDLLLLDEPTAGMSPDETNSLINFIKQLSSDTNITILFTEHDMKFVFSIADYITVLQQGQVIAEGLPDEVKNNQKVIEAYIGEEKNPQ